MICPKSRKRAIRSLITATYLVRAVALFFTFLCRRSAQYIPFVVYRNRFFSFCRLYSSYSLRALFFTHTRTRFACRKSRACRVRVCMRVYTRQMYISCHRVNGLSPAADACITRRRFKSVGQTQSACNDRRERGIVPPGHRKQR